jgi:hypothetical protein
MILVESRITTSFFPTRTCTARSVDSWLVDFDANQEQPMNSLQSY